MNELILKNPLLESYRTHKEEIDEAIQRVLDSGWYILGNEVTAFEREFSQYLGAGYGVGCGSGTDAIELALRSCGIGKGDEVITVSHTAVATVAAIELAGATPVLVEVNPNTYTMEPEDFYHAITPKTKAVIPVHLYGLPARMEYIVEIANAHELFVIEDCAQSHGATIGNKKTGTFGDISAFSFYPTKNLGAIGDGGMVVTDHEELAENARLLRQYGWKERYVSDRAGMNSRLDEIQAAILRVKLKYLDKDNEQRRKVAKAYTKYLTAPFVLPIEPPRNTHVYHQYVIRAENRDNLKVYLSTSGIETAIHYPVPVHLQPAYQNVNHGILETTEAICKEILSLPMHPSMQEDDARIISSVVNEFYPR
jgi:dTDP-4-amino-4,6-dideoxygalactose transaminase